MAESTGISWTNSTWNPWRGCVKVSEGCKHCYADDLAKRNPATLGVWGPEGIGTRVVAAESYWREPLKWDRKAKESGQPWRVFCCSLADVFEEWGGPVHDTCGNRLHAAPGLIGGTTKSDHWYSESPCDDSPAPLATLDDVRARAFAMMESTPHLTWLVLTKRPENILRMAPPAWLKKWPANVWPGATTENQARAAERIPHLLKVPAAVRWLSVEPQIGPVDLARWLPIYRTRGASGQLAGPWMRSASYPSEGSPTWIITGGESGHGARPFQIEWARSLRDQCKAASVAFFHKQMGDDPREHDPSAWPVVPSTGEWPNNPTRKPLTLVGDGFGNHLVRGLSKAGKDPAEWPEDLRVQEFPEAAWPRRPAAVAGRQNYHVTT